MEYNSDNVTEKQIKWSYWWLNNVDKFKLFGLTIVATLIAALWLYVFYSLIMTAVDWQNEFAYKSILSRQTKYSVTETSAPQPLVIGQISVLNAGQQKYDVVVPVSNDNKDWLVASLKYFISYNDGATTTVRDVIIQPAKQSYLTAFSITSERKPYNVNIEIVDQKWRRVANVKTVPMEFVLETVKISADDNGISQRAEVDITNKSLANYWELKWLAVAYSGYQPVAAQEVTTEEFLALAKRRVYFNWSNRLPRIERLEVVPQFNIFDFSLLYKEEAEAPKY